MTAHRVKKFGPRAQESQPRRKVNRGRSKGDPLVHIGPSLRLNQSELPFFFPLPLLTGRSAFWHSIFWPATSGSPWHAAQFLDNARPDLASLNAGYPPRHARQGARMPKNAIPAQSYTATDAGRQRHTLLFPGFVPGTPMQTTILSVSLGRWLRLHTVLHVKVSSWTLSTSNSLIGVIIPPVIRILNLMVSGVMNA